MKRYRHLFGPVPSRRLGRSLGVDLVPLKTCSANCVFCQLGRTAHATVERKEYVPIDQVLAELKEWLRHGGSADFITLAGSGEPTLHSRFGAVIEFARRNTSIPSALLSNGTLFHLPEVREAACGAAVVKLSLSAWDQGSFQSVSRPHPSLSFDNLMAGYRTFRREHPGQVWLEVFLVEGLNSDPRDVEKIAALAASLSPDRIHLNTVVRPPAEAVAAAVSPARLEALSRLFTPRADVIAEFSSTCSARAPLSDDAIVALVRRHPSTVEDIALSFGLPTAAAAEEVRRLLCGQRVRAEQRNGRTFYVPA